MRAEVRISFKEETRNVKAERLKRTGKIKSKITIKIKIRRFGSRDLPRPVNHFVLRAGVVVYWAGANRKNWAVPVNGAM